MTYLALSTPTETSEGQNRWHFFSSFKLLACFSSPCRGILVEQLSHHDRRRAHVNGRGGHFVLSVGPVALHQASHQEIHFWTTPTRWVSDFRYVRLLLSNYPSSSIFGFLRGKWTFYQKCLPVTVIFRTLLSPQLLLIQLFSYRCTCRWSTAWFALVLSCCWACHKKHRDEHHWVIVLKHLWLLDPWETSCTTGLSSLCQIRPGAWFERHQLSLCQSTDIVLPVSFVNK